LRVAYQVDEEALLPEIHQKETAPPRTIKVRQFNAKKVKVKGSKKRDHLEFVPEELPEVALRGGIEVEAIEEATEAAVEEAAETSSDNQSQQQKVRVKPKRGTQIKLSLKRDNHINQGLNTKYRQNISDTRHSQATGQTISMTRKEHTAASVRETKSQATSVKFAPKSISENRVQPVGLSSWVATSPLIATLAAIAVSALLFTVSADVQVGDGNFSSGLRLQLANLLAIFLP
jgi:hypothetical protein